MGLIQKLRRAIQGKKSQTIPLTHSGGKNYFFTGLDGWSYNTRNAEEFTRNGYGRNPYVYAVVDKISKVAARLPRELTDKEGAELRESLYTSDFLELMEQPNYQGGTAHFYYKIFASLLTTGNAFLYVDQPELFGGRASEILLALPKNVTIQTENGREDGRPISYSISPYGVFPAENVLHIKFPNIVEETNWGLSPLYSGQAIYTASNNNFAAKAAILDNRGVSGILTSKDANMPMNPSEQERLQRDWQQRTAGAHNFGGIHVTTQALDFLDVGMSSKDLELVAHNTELLRDVCRIYGVDSSLFGDPQNRTYSNQEQAIEAFYTDVVLPLSNMVDKELTKFLVSDMFSLGDAVWQVDISDIKVLNKPEQELSTKLIAEVSAGILSPEEARLLLYPEL